MHLTIMRMIFISIFHGFHCLTWAYIFTIGNASSVEDPSKMELNNGGKYSRHRSTCCAIFCGCIVLEDCRKDDLLQQQSGEDALFCTLCNAEVRYFTSNIHSNWDIQANLVFFKSWDTFYSTRCTITSFTQKE